MADSAVPATTPTTPVPAAAAPAPAAEVPANPNPAPTEAPVPAAEPSPNGSLLPEGEAAPPAEAKPDEPAPVEPLTAESLALPEGIAKDDPGLAKFLETFNDTKLSPKERAEAMLGSYKEVMSDVATKAAAATHAEYTKINDKWIAESQADPVIGKPEAMAAVSKALDAYGNGPELRKVFALTGAGNNPHVIRLLHSMAQRLGEGSPAQGSTPAPTKSLAQQFYPGTPETPSQG